MIRKEKIRDLFVVFAIVAIITAFFGKIIYFRATLYGSDFIAYFYPIKKFIYDYFSKNGSFPFWNPYLFSGTPFIANIQASMFYPLGFLYYLLPTDVAYLYSTIFHCILGAVFMYLFMRTIKCSPAGSFLSGFIFVFNGYFMAHIYAGHLSFVQNYIWIPLVFVFLIKFLKTKKFVHTVLAGLVLSVQILGGFPQIAFYTILTIISCLLFYSIVHIKDGRYSWIASYGIGLLITLFVGFSVAAVQLLPTLEFSGLSGRAGGVSYQFAISESLDPSDLLSFLVPDVFGNVTDQTYWKSNEVWHFWETCAYVGLLPLLLAFVKVKSASLHQFRRFCILMVIGALFLALGKHNPIYPFVYHLPGFGSFRIPSQIIFLYVFGISMLAGIGMQGMTASPAFLNRGFYLFYLIAGGVLLFLTVGLSFFPSDVLSYLFKIFAADKITKIDVNRFYARICFSVDKGLLLLFGSALLVLAAKIRKINLRIFNMLAIGIIVMDLYLFSIQFIKPYAFETPPWKEALISKLNKTPERGRADLHPPDSMPNDALRYQFPSVTGYDPLILKRYIEYIQSSQEKPFDQHVINIWKITKPQAKLLKLLNLREIVADSEIRSVENGIPYVNFVREAIAKNSDEVLSYMNSGQFDPVKTVVLEDDGEKELIDENEKSIDINGYYSIIKYENEEIQIAISTDQSCYLVLSEIFYPGWRAIVDGKEIPAFRGNYIFRVVPLEKGNHDVVFDFVSWPFRIGLLVSLIVLISSMWFILRFRKY